MRRLIFPEQISITPGITTGIFGFHRVRAENVSSKTAYYIVIDKCWWYVKKLSPGGRKYISFTKKISGFHKLESKDEYGTFHYSLYNTRGLYARKKMAKKNLIAILHIHNKCHSHPKRIVEQHSKYILHDWVWAF